MSGRYGFSSGFPSGKSSGWNGRLKACPPPLGGRPSASHSIPLTFPQEIPRKTHTFPPLVNKNIPFTVRLFIVCLVTEGPPLIVVPHTMGPYTVGRLIVYPLSVGPSPLGQFILGPSPSIRTLIQPIVLCSAGILAPSFLFL